MAIARRHSTPPFSYECSVIGLRPPSGLQGVSKLPRRKMFGFVLFKQETLSAVLEVCFCGAPTVDVR